jgi:hypothetical protein
VLCTSCGGKLKEAQKFCGGCGSKVQATVPKPGAGSDPVVMIAPLMLELPTMPIEIGSVKIEGPDGDGNFSMIASCKFTNNSKEDWDFLEIRAHLINSDGIVLQESTDTPEELIEASGLYEHEVRFWNVPAAHLGEAEKATVVLSAISSKKHSHEFQDVPIPSTANEINDLAPPCLVGSSLYFTSGSIWKTKPDDDKESRVELNLLLQNTSNTALSKVRLTAEILDKQGKSLTDIGNDKEMRSGELMLLSSGYNNVKDKKLHGAKVKLSVQSYCPVAAAVVRKTGAEVVAADCDSGWGPSSGDEESDVNSDEHDEVARSGSTMSFEWRMDNGEINMNDVEDDDVRAALKSALKLAKAKKFEEAVRALPSMDFEYNFSNLDSDASEYFAETDGISFQLDLSDPKHIIQVGVSGNKLNLSVTVLFDVPVKAGLNVDDLNGWLADNGGYAAGFAAGGWSYNGDEGGHMRNIDNIKNNEPAFVTMEANIKWGYSNDDVNIDNLPTAFVQAKKLWATKKAENIKKAGDLIVPFIACIFVEGNCDGQLSELFLQSMDEIEADSISVFGLDFSESNLPKLKISAKFSNLKSNGLLDKNRLDAWQDDNGYLDSCISFEWRIDGVDEDLDLRSWNHAGLSFLLVD